MATERHERQPFCPQCGLVETTDEEGCCPHCGADTCGLDLMRALLAAEGLHVVSEADRAVLKAASEFFDARDIEGDERAFETLTEAEQARREAQKETP